MLFTQTRRSEILTCTIVEGIEHSKEGADDKNVGVLMNRHFMKYSWKMMWCWDMR
jgi:hypothetical protein